MMRNKRKILFLIASGIVLAIGVYRYLTMPPDIVLPVHPDAKDVLSLENRPARGAKSVVYRVDYSATDFSGHGK